MSATPQRNIFDLLEQFFTKRKSPGELVCAGVLQADPTVRGPGEGSGCFFNRFLNQVPKISGVPTIVVQCCEHLESTGTHCSSTLTERRLSSSKLSGLQEE